ncbi:HNH endonuclease [Hydrogenoanaerobacterium sp.]|uniref:HNH endonuclease n=1 Tax=Hydrogenoanaerobacterium sp. TaxID=2953763 RepID=UPI00289B3A17|nr:HNH endonuclease [Hydrogenoanaerobacterium sp.]
MALDEFQSWMREHTALSDSSVYKYTRAVHTISNDMQSIGVIRKDLLSMTRVELDLSIALILSNGDFIAKNNKGNNMYSNSLKQYRLFSVDSFEDYDADTKLIDEVNQSNISATEKESIIKARVGQGQYRKALLDKYDNRCVVTGIDHKKLLMASHIKPWAICENRERADSENGLLLSANMDKLFDSGLITFANDGKLYVSSFVGKENENRLHINSSIVVDLKATQKLLEYLEFHRDVLFVK